MWGWLDPGGRCSNGEYLRIAAICSAIAGPVVAVLALDRLPTALRLGGVVVLWILTGVMWLVAIRRAHDEDYPAREAYAWMGGPTLLLIVWITLPAFGVTPHLWIRLAAFAAALFLCHVGLYVVVQGRDGARPNRFGPPTIQRPGVADRMRYRGLVQKTQRPD